MEQIESRRQAGISLSKLKTERLFNQLPELVNHLAHMTDIQLLQAFVRAEQLADFAFLVRGACASELRKRALRLPGGRGKTDTAGRGLQAQMNALASKVGTGRKTLEMDARIKDTFFPVIDETTLEHMPPLAREYYVIALSAPDPLAALQTAINRCMQHDFTLRRFRAEIRRHKTTVPISDVSASSEPQFALNVRVSAEVDTLISELTMKTGMTHDEIVAEAVRALHTSLSKSLDHMTHTSKTPRSNMRTHGDTQLELKL